MSAEVAWKLFGGIAEAAGQRRVTVHLEEDATVAEALDVLLEETPAIRDRVLVDGALASHVTVLRNGEQVDPSEESEAVDGIDELALLPPVSGG